jgi:hypothetical protein
MLSQTEPVLRPSITSKICSKGINSEHAPHDGDQLFFRPLVAAAGQVDSRTTNSGSTTIC